ncbi:ATP-binding protein [Streptomyces griseoluteus]|uniref:ATP-binding protein n=1 Tax=Streptomyces griseoluteus TaxID=29306 RepID=UPI00343010CD
MDLPLTTDTMTRTTPELPRYSRRWDADTASLPEARDAVADLLARVRPTPSARTVQDAQLVASELVTNALKHAPGPFTLHMEVVSDPAALRISVTDSSPRPPRDRPPNPERVGGHGLRLVRLLCGALEVTPLGRGKRVTASVALDDGRTFS